MAKTLAEILAEAQLADQSLALEREKSRRQAAGSQAWLDALGVGIKGLADAGIGAYKTADDAAQRDAATAAAQYAGQTGARDEAKSFVGVDPVKGPRADLSYLLSPQDIAQSSIKGSPLESKTKPDGNWIENFFADPGETLGIKARARAAAQAGVAQNVTKARDKAQKDAEDLLKLQTSFTTSGLDRGEKAREFDTEQTTKKKFHDDTIQLEDRKLKQTASENEKNRTNAKDIAGMKITAAKEAAQTKADAKKADEDPNKLTNAYRTEAQKKIAEVSILNSDAQDLRDKFLSAEQRFEALGLGKVARAKMTVEQFIGALQQKDANLATAIGNFFDAYRHAITGAGAQVAELEILATRTPQLGDTIEQALGKLDAHQEHYKRVLNYYGQQLKTGKADVSPSSEIENAFGVQEE